MGHQGKHGHSRIRFSSVTSTLVNSVEKTSTQGRDCEPINPFTKDIDIDGSFFTPMRHLLDSRFGLNTAISFGFRQPHCFAQYFSHLITRQQFFAEFAAVDRNRLKLLSFQCEPQ